MDRREMDEDVLRMAGGDRLPADAAAADRAARLAGAVARSSGTGPLSVTELRREREAKEQAERAKVVRYIEQGDSFRDQGKLTTARAFYRMAWQRTSDESLRTELKDRLTQLERR
jgi:hypothetical protein